MVNNATYINYKSKQHYAKVVVLWLPLKRNDGIVIWWGTEVISEEL